MAFEAGSIIARVKADTTDFKRGMGEAKRHAGGLHTGLGKLAGGIKLFARGAAIAGTAVAAFGGLALKEFSASENSLAQLNAVLKSTGGIAGVTAKQATDLAASLQGVTKFSDEMILDGENLLLTFTKIGKDIFPQATETMLDMSQALGQDLKSSAVQLGKALQDPILGVTALRRVGVNFSKAQRDVIERLVNSGKTMEAQKMILKELQVEFGGSAKAAGQTLSGQLVILKNTFSDLMEIMGGGLARWIMPLIQAFNAWVDANGGIEATITLVRKKISDLGAEIMSRLTPAIQLLTAVWNFLKPSVMALWDTIQKQLMPSLRELWKQLSPILGPALKALAILIGVTIIAALWAAINILRVIIGVVARFAAGFSIVVRAVRSAVSGTINAIRGINGAITNALKSVWSSITEPFRKAFDWVKNKIDEVKNKMKDLNPLQRHSPSIVDLLNRGVPEMVKVYARGFDQLTKMAAGVRPQLAGAMVGANATVNTNIYGNIQANNPEDRASFFRELNRNQELAAKNIAARPRTV